MSTMKTHYATVLDHGGIIITGTLCGVLAPSHHEINSSTDTKDVTCTLCKQSIGNKKSWRWRRFLKYGVKT